MQYLKQLFCNRVQQDDVQYQNENQLKQLENEIPDLQRCLCGEIVSIYELGNHDCNAYLECEFCSERVKEEFYNYHIKAVHGQKFCQFCKSELPNYESQDHVLTCFQVYEFGFDDAKIQQQEAKSQCCYQELDEEYQYDLNEENVYHYP